MVVVDQQGAGDGELLRADAVDAVAAVADRDTVDCDDVGALARHHVVDGDAADHVAAGAGDVDVAYEHGAVAADADVDHRLVAVLGGAVEDGAVGDGQAAVDVGAGADGGHGVLRECASGDGEGCAGLADRQSSGRRQLAVAEAEGAVGDVETRGAEAAQGGVLEVEVPDASSPGAVVDDVYALGGGGGVGAGDEGAGGGVAQLVVALDADLCRAGDAQGHARLEGEAVAGLDGDVARKQVDVVCHLAQA